LRRHVILKPREPDLLELEAQHDFNRRPNDGSERFEGDYEHFEERSTPSTRPVNKPFETRDTRSQRPNSKPFEGRGPRDTRPSRPEGRAFEARDTRNARPPRPAGRPFSGSRSPQGKRFDDKSEAQPERHVTRLPDGRVLKGPRPVQRKNAQFWTGVSSDTSELVGQVQEEKPNKQTQEESTNEAIKTPPENVALETPAVFASEYSEAPSAERSAITNGQSNEGVSEVTSTEEGVSEATPPKRRTRTASAVTRTKKPRSTGPKPSQRGFKWPAQE